MTDNSGWPSILAWAQTVNPMPFIAGAVTLVGAYFAGAKGLRDSGSAARKTKADNDIALRGRLSAEAAEALDRKEADNASLRAERASLEKQLDEAWDAAHAMEDWARNFARVEFGNALLEMDRVYRLVGQVLAKPPDEAIHAEAQRILDARKAWPNPVVPSPAECRSKRT